VSDPRAVEEQGIPAWAESLLSSALRRHGKDRRALVKAIAAFQKLSSLYDPPEQQAAYKHVVDGLKKRLDELPAPYEPERAP
jgi:hypothetical protein